MNLDIKVCAIDHCTIRLSKDATPLSFTGNVTGNNVVVANKDARKRLAGCTNRTPGLRSCRAIQFAEFNVANKNKGVVGIAFRINFAVVQVGADTFKFGFCTDAVGFDFLAADIIGCIVKFLTVLIHDRFTNVFRQLAAIGLGKAGLLADHGFAADIAASAAVVGVGEINALAIAGTKAFLAGRRAGTIGTGEAVFNDIVIRADIAASTAVFNIIGDLDFAAIARITIAIRKAISAFRDLADAVTAGRFGNIVKKRAVGTGIFFRAAAVVGIVLGINAGKHVSVEFAERKAIIAGAFAANAGLEITAGNAKEVRALRIAVTAGALRATEIDVLRSINAATGAFSLANLAGFAGAGAIHAAFIALAGIADLATVLRRTKADAF